MILTIKLIAISILIVGVVIASYTDYRTLTISNKLTFFMFLSGLTLGSYYYINFNMSGLLRYYISILITFIFVYILWHIGLWAGGDVKLLTSISTLLCVDYLDIIPTFHLANNIYPLFDKMFFIPTFVLIANSVLSIVPIILFIIIYEIIKNKPHLMKVLINDNDLINIISTLNSLILIFLINELIHIDNIILNIVFLIVISYITNRLAKKNKYINIILNIIILITMISNKYIQIYVIEAIIVTSVVIIKNIIKNNLLKEALSYDVNINQLKESMIPAYKLVRYNNKYFFDKQTLKEKITNKKDYEVIITQKASGLIDEDIELLKNLYNNGFISENVKIKHSVAFAPFILSGLIITLTLGNSISIIKDLIGVIL